MPQESSRRVISRTSVKSQETSEVSIDQKPNKQQLDEQIKSQQGKEKLAKATSTFEMIIDIDSLNFFLYLRR